MRLMDLLRDWGVRGFSVKQTMVFGHIFVVFRQRGGEEVATLGIRDKKEVIGWSGVQGGLQRGLAGIADGTRGKAGVDVGVIRRVVAEVLPSERGLVIVDLLEGVNDRGVALEQHFPVQPVGIYAGDEGTLVGLGSFRFDQGSESNDGEKRSSGSERVKSIGSNLLEGIAEFTDHDTREVAGRETMGKVVGRGKEKALESFGAGSHVLNLRGVGGCREEVCRTHVFRAFQIASDVEDGVAFMDGKELLEDFTLR